MILLQLFLAGLASAHSHGTASSSMLGAELRYDGEVKQMVNMVEEGANAVASTETSRIIRREDIHDVLLAPVDGSYFNKSVYAKGDFFRFFGFFGFVLCVFGMVRQPYSEDLRRSTWRMLSRSISLFCAVLTFMASRKLYRLYGGPSGSHPFFDDVVSLFRFVFFLFVLPVIADKLQHRPLMHGAVQELTPFLIGFAGADGAAELLREDPWATGAGYYFLGVLLMFLLLAAMMALAARQRGSLQQVHIEAIGFCAGFLICLWLRFCITGFVPGTKSGGRGLTYHDVIYLFLVTGGFKILYTVAVMTLHSAAGSSEKPMMSGFAKITLETCALTLAFLGLYSVQWFCVYTFAPAHAGTAGLYDAAAAIPFFTSITVIISMVTLDMIARRMGRSAGKLTELLSVYAVLIGFSNEMVFWSVSIEGKLTSTAGVHPKVRAQSIFLGTILTVGILLLLWVRFILPNAPRDSDDGDEVGLAKDEGASAQDSAARAAASADTDTARAAPTSPDEAAAAAPGAAAVPASGAQAETKKDEKADLEPGAAAAPASRAPAEPKKDETAGSEAEAAAAPAAGAPAEPQKDGNADTEEIF